MRILAIETSCDETGAAILEKKDNHIKVLSNIIATSSDMHAKTGGIIPENASREQVKAIIPAVVTALIEARGDTGGRAPDTRTIERSERARARRKPVAGPRNPQISWKQANEIINSDIDAIAITHGPGLIGSLLVGVETAKTLSFALNKPIIPVNHLLAHIFANFIGDYRRIKFPFIGLIVSGGHTDLLLFEQINKFKWLGGTRDDAAGEALDKIGRLLDLPYPSGAEIEKRANKVKKSNIKFQSPLLNSEDFDFSFSGLKAEVARFVDSRGDTGGRAPDTRTVELSERARARRKPVAGPRVLKDEICFAVQQAIFAVLIKKTIRAAKMYNCKQILLGGGVSANKTLREMFELDAKHYLLNAKIFSPEKRLATDNAAMIGAYALLNYKTVPWKKVAARPELYFD